MDSSDGPTGSDPIGQLYNESIRPLITAFTFQVLFYGMYISLGVTYINVMTRQKREEKFKHIFYPISTLLLFVLATVGVILSSFDIGNLTRLLLMNMVNLDPTDREFTFVKTRTAIGVVYSLANLLGDIILARFMRVVGHVLQYLVYLLTPLILVIVFASSAEIQLGSKDEFATNGFSPQVAVGDQLLYAFLGINVFNNILLTGLIAGRLWYINNTAAKLFGTSPSPDRRYYAIVAMFLESGSLYPIALIICLAIQVTGSPASMDPILLQIVGIAPMLILVRTTLGVSIEHAPRREDVETELDDTSPRYRTHSTSLEQKITPFSSVPTGSSSLHDTTFSGYKSPGSISGSQTVLLEHPGNGTTSWTSHPQKFAHGRSVEGGQDPSRSPAVSFTSERLHPLRVSHEKV
ncbi:hypothetical protein D9757_004455 [Collybiopsis confluens]|uniref:Uncharacterized protein n=1 Tax=Collybiopsis confluens TaxID=2823264 RepID=A0A8H5HWS0_9AGAR|nr:hypothetical protein D9757_004455 [Collybiopsis confluens]